MSEFFHHDFNTNEWSIIISLIFGIVVVFLLPKRFTKKNTCLYLLCCMFFGFLHDHTLSVLPVSYYEINDSSSFEFMDFLSHAVYAPYSYLFFYLLNLFRIKPRFTLLYILIWAFVSVAFERLFVFLGIFHYQNGYNTYYSFLIYLFVLSLWVLFYFIIQTYGEKRY